ncbi:uncharacterized protein CANTADRAFT_87993 [Suhomyces tanzawaensis NRRL Y-17324]|uniref:RRM domain-containing protein n=1 Tax=Suhomyces tanzawaensis NRRL Y-17324 TaxID=984487 RepID=A0A1E4SRB5_9ASCO|nr:uncharacterized protein CANTADRAFT_87993 [Suhomyces tanzawaensis NRRL Y-17324]ODV82053.1 hypothetical protein CANTADRAFT_87993 [Suhomyces tanzawaensis NRRL Y-17324]
MEEMDIDDYSRDRSRSPVRERSRSPQREPVREREQDTKDYSRRDYGYSRNSYDRSSRGGRRDYDSGRGGRRGGRGGSARDYSSRRDFDSSASSDEVYRAKTERNYDNSIFIGNIPFDCTSKDVEEMFGSEFTIVRADIVTNKGRSRGMATVEFSTKDHVRDAIAKFDHHEYRGREIFVRQDYPPPDKKQREPIRKKERVENPERSTTAPKSGTEIFVGNLPFSVNWQALKDLMRGAGEVERADVRMDDWGKSRGFGTVVFLTPEEATKAVEMFQGYEIEGRKLDTRPGRGTTATNGATQSRTRDTYDGSRSRRDAPADLPKNTEFTEGVVAGGERSDTVFVANLPYVTNNDDLYELFETVGRTNKAEIQYNENGKATGNAVVQFELAELAENAIQNLDNYLYGGRNLQISYAKRQ